MLNFIFCTPGPCRPTVPVTNLPVELCASHQLKSGPKPTYLLTSPPYKVGPLFCFYYLGFIDHKMVYKNIFQNMNLKFLSIRPTSQK